MRIFIGILTIVVSMGCTKTSAPKKGDCILSTTKKEKPGYIVRAVDENHYTITYIRRTGFPDYEDVDFSHKIEIGSNLDSEIRRRIIQCPAQIKLPGDN